MNVREQIEDLGPPTLELGPLAIWVLGRQYPDAQDYWDGNWFMAAARCHSPCAEAVLPVGPFLHLSDVQRWLRGLQLTDRELKHRARASLEPIEPELRVIVDSDSHGRLEIRVQFSTDHGSEKHDFRIELEQSYLPRLISQCERVLAEYPLRGNEPKRIGD